MSTEQPNYWPVTWTAFWAQWQLFGLNPFGYHLVNVLLHAANAILQWRNGKAWIALEKPGSYLAARGQYDEAVAHFRQSLELKPDLAEAHYNWGLALASQGRHGEAVGHFREALSIDPNYDNAKRGLAEAMAKSGSR